MKGRGDDGDPGILRIDFPGFSGGESLAPLGWDDWFRAFEDNGLAFLHQDETAGGEQSRFNKLVSRDTVERRAQGESGAPVHRPRH